MSDEIQAGEATETTTESAPAPESSPTAPEKPLSPHDALRAAASKLAGETKPATQKTQATTKPQEKAPAKPAGPVRDPSGRFAPATATAEVAPKPGEAPPAAGDTPAEPAREEAATEAKPTARAPQSWTPAAREEWAKVPAAVQEQVMKREREVATALQEASGHRRTAEALQQTLAPYEALFRSSNVDPIRGVGQLAQTAWILNTGAPQQRAQALAHMVKSFLGTDDGAIQLLASAIDGAPGQASGPAAAQPVNPAQIAQQVEQQIMQRLGQQRAQQAQQRAQETMQKLSEQFEFFEDVRQDVADILDLAARRGNHITPEQAYHRAVAMNPELSKIVQQREAAKAAATAQAATQRTAAAASSLRSSPGSAPAVAGKNLDRGQALRQAAADVAGRGRV